MKSNKFLENILLVCGILIGVGFIYILYNQSELNKTNSELREENEKLKIRLNEKPEEVKVHVTDTVYMSMFDDETTVYGYTYPRFKVFNKNIDSCTVGKFVEVMSHYKLDTTQKMIEMYVGQILLESGAKQYRPSGELVVSSAGAIGMCQILPSTCFGYMKKYVSEEDIKEMTELGCSDFSFVYDDSLSKGSRIKMCREWLSEETNNMIMWGYITKNNIDRKGDIIKQLVAYNTGTRNMKKYINAGNSLYNHAYIRGINSKISVAESEVALMN